MNDHKDLINIIMNDNVSELKNKVKNMCNVESANYSIKIHAIINDNTQNTATDQTDLIDEDGLTLLHVAAYYDALDCFRYLQKSRQISLRKLSSHAFLPLHYACWAGSSEVALYILSEDPQQYNFQVQGSHDIQLLYCSLMGGDLEIIETLFSLGLELEASYNNQEKILEKSIGLHNPDILLTVLNHYKPKKGSVDCAPVVKAVLSHNPEALATIYKGKEDISQTIPERPHDNLISLICENDRDKKFKNLLLTKIIKDAKDMDLEPTNPNLPGICHWACTYMDVEVAKQLFKLPCCKIDRLESGKTGPSKLVNKKDKVIPDMLNCLIDCGFDINNTYDGKTPSLLESFAINSIQKNIPAIRVLIDRGGDIDAPCLKAKQNSKNLTIYEYVMEMRGCTPPLKELFNDAKRQKNKK